MKKRFEYGTLIFSLTFSLVSIFENRMEELKSLTHQRLPTIIIGTSLCILFIHKLANSLHSDDAVSVFSLNQPFTLDSEAELSEKELGIVVGWQICYCCWRTIDGGTDYLFYITYSCMNFDLL